MASRGSRTLLLALALPIVAVALMAVRAEMVSRTGRAYRLKIEGYDPRDILSGQYLRYRVAFRWDAVGDRCTAAECCYCLNGPEGEEPTANRVSCSARGASDAWFRETETERMQRFYIPEGRGAPLEKALRDKRAEIVVRISGNGSVVVQDLLLDGKPWRAVVDAH
jgi:uncharacterized membrane-anchored protein